MNKPTCKAVHAKTGVKCGHPEGHYEKYWHTHNLFSWPEEECEGYVKPEAPKASVEDRIDLLEWQVKVLLQLHGYDFIRPVEGMIPKVDKGPGFAEQQPLSPCCRKTMRDNTTHYICECGKLWVPVGITVPVQWKPFFIWEESMTEPMGARERVLRSLCDWKVLAATEHFLNHPETDKIDLNWSVGRTVEEMEAYAAPWRKRVEELERENTLLRSRLLIFEKS
jgi:hypothetical protein